MPICFNEIKPFAVEWLGNLFPTATIEDGSIKNVSANDIVRFDRCHFFAGIGGWEIALQLAGWPANRPVWTGSCPCQPYSSAGKGEGDKDARNLWPDFFRLIRECRPDTIFGEQVASAIGHGWLDGIQRDLEGEGYAVGHCVLGAHSVGSPHIRQRLYWVANSNGVRHDGRKNSTGAREQKQHHEAETGSRRCAVADPDKPIVRGLASTGQQSEYEQNGGTGGLANSASGGRGVIGNAAQSRSFGHADGGGESDELGIADFSRPQGYAGNVADGNGPGRIDANEIRSTASTSAWSDSIAIECTDGRSRRISAEPGDEPLAYWIPAKLGPLMSWLGRLGLDAATVTRMARLARRTRTGRLRGYGNAIVPQVAAEFIKAFMETEL